MIDYPKKLASVLYVTGCNFRCPFCHNGNLIDTQVSLDRSTVLEHLMKRKNIIDGVVISGGEPTIHDLDFIKEIKKIGYLVKLDTNGYKPDVIQHLMDQRLIDYIAMDVKNGLRRYNETSGCEVDIDRIRETIDLIKNSDVDYEFRVTLTKAFHSLEDIEGVFELVRHTEKLVLQQYHYSDKQIVDRDFGYYTINEMKSFKSKFQMKYNIDKVIIKGKY